jgi:hypothetical protein
MKLFALSFALAAASLSAGSIYAADKPPVTSPSQQVKVSFKEAKAECLKEDSKLEGQALKKCIHTKRKLASNKSS